MNDKHLAVLGNSGDDDGNLQITIEKNHLGKFLADLLGQPRTIKKRSEREFDVDHQFLCNLDSIIEQRITSQQDASLVSFSAAIVFKDNSVQIINSREAFRAFDDISDAPTIKVDLVWAYLVIFPGKKVPEKQQIRISIDTGSYPENTRFDNKRLARIIGGFVLSSSEAQIDITIEYTELTWGLDLLRHIEAEFRKRFLIEGRTESCRKFAGIFIPFATAMAIPLIGGLYQFVDWRGISVEQKKILRELGGVADFNGEVILRLKFLMAAFPQVSAIHDARFWVYLIAAALFLVSGWLFVLQQPQSFLLLNSAATKKKEEYLERRSRMRNGLILTLVLGIVSSVAAEKISAVVSAWL